MAISQDFLQGVNLNGDVPPPEMPGLIPDETSGDALDLYPEDEEARRKLVAWCNSAFLSAERFRTSYEDRWKRYYRLYRSHMERRVGDWHSTVFVPIAFWIIETITPRMVAQLPKFTAYPVGPDDQMAAKHMETLLDNAVKESELYVELVKAFKSALKYGTGILKTFYREDTRRARKKVTRPATLRIPVPTPVLDPDTGDPMMDLDNNPLTTVEEVEVAGPPVETVEKYSYFGYQGPATECIDIFNFWVAPEAHDIDSARYVIQRVYKEMSYVKRKVAEGVYHKPDELSWEDLADVSDEPHLERLGQIGLGSMGDDSTRKPVELLEFWTDDGRVITLANRKAILRVQENPFDHSEKPFIRVVDYVQEHEFWGVGEIEPLEGLQDLHNALVNSRIDNVRLVLNSMFAVNVQNLEDLRDLEMRPGGAIRLKTDVKPDEVIKRIDLGDVTSSAFTEAEVNERTIEKVSGVSAYQMGLDSPSYNNTATGVAIIQEQGASRFGLKAKMAELMGLKRLGRHYGSIIQQFTTEEKWIRLAGPEGQFVFQHFTPESLYGSLDYDIEAESTTQTQTVRQNQKQTILQLMATYNPNGVMAALNDLLDEMGIKDKQAYFGGQPTMPTPQQGQGQEQGLPLAQGPQLPPDIAAQRQAYGELNPAAGTQGQAMGDARMAQLAASYQFPA